MSPNTPKSGSAEWYSRLADLPTPLVRPLELYAASFGNESLRWAACRDFCTLTLSLLHGLALAARAGTSGRPAPRPPVAPFPRFQERLDWMTPRAIFQTWAGVNPSLPKAARLPMDRALAFPELHAYADERGLARPTHAVEALAMLQALANETVADRLAPCAIKTASAALDDLVSRLAFRELRFLARWTLAIRLPVPDDAHEATHHHGLVLRGPAPRCTDLPEGMRSAPSTRVVALPAANGPALNLYPFCLFDAPPDLGPALGSDSSATTRWLVPQLMVCASDLPLYRCTASGALVGRPELAGIVAGALRGASVSSVSGRMRWGLLWIAIRQMRELNKACTHGKADRILLAMDSAAARWVLRDGASDGIGPTAFPFWRHGDEMAIPFRYAEGVDPLGAVRSASAQIVAAATREALACGIGIPWPACEADQGTHTPTAGPLKLSVGFTLDVGIDPRSHEPFSRRMVAELDQIRKAAKVLVKEQSTSIPLLWIGRQTTGDEWRAEVAPLFARISEAAFVIVRNAAQPNEWLLRRNRHRGIYNLIGGHLEAMDGNDGLALIRREIREELGLTVAASELRPLAAAPVMATEYSDRARCMTFYVAHVFEMTLPLDRFDEAACRAHDCRWEQAERVMAHAAPDIARFPARLLATTADDTPKLRHTHSLTDWPTLSALDQYSGDDALAGENSRLVAPAVPGAGEMQYSGRYEPADAQGQAKHN